MSSELQSLGTLPKNLTAKIIGFRDSDPELVTRLREIGFAEDDNVTAMHFGLFGRNPMSVRLNGAIIALRREDATAILVEAIAV
ncbi:FeoA family protein [Litorimonas sp. RW-G-Af-16]|uniref:FeoA family protein n=1 Tax=Litorimonas sp. RW-G-Af-16 TaxID=3241168 RepID=UPI00390C7619